MNGVFMWIRNTAAKTANVRRVHFKKRGTALRSWPERRLTTDVSVRQGLCDHTAWRASAPWWGAMGGDTANMHYWEYNSTNLSDGSQDVSQRAGVR